MSLQLSSMEQLFFLERDPGKSVTFCFSVELYEEVNPARLKEAAEIAEKAGALVINIGTLSERTIDAMFAAGKSANAAGVPVVLDPVGAGASKLRSEISQRLLKKIKFSVIRGNASEITALCCGKTCGKGVDSEKQEEESVLAAAKELSKRTGAGVAVSGETDIIAERDEVKRIKNGHAMMERITGSGCMLSALIGAFVGANPKKAFLATAAAFCVLGIAGEQAYEKIMEKCEGTGSFRTYMIDAVSLMDGEVLKRRMRVE